jgi:photosystem II stability/assembly factor-like uncharacterized protein
MQTLRFSFRLPILAAAVLTIVAATVVVCSLHALARGKQPPGGEQAPGQSPNSEKAPAAFKTSQITVTRLCDLPEKEEYGHPLVQFLNERDGWVTTGRKLWKTTDAGATWECTFDGGLDQFKFSRDIYDFQFVSAKLGWVLTFDQLRKTTDGGRTWRLLSNPLSDGWLRSFKFLKDGKVGWVGGGLYQDLGEGEETPNRFHHAVLNRGLFAAAFRTEDGGETWRNEPVSQSPGDIFRFYFLDQDHGWAIGQAGDFYLKDGKWCQSLSGDVDGRDEAKDEEDSPVKCEEIAIGGPTYCPVAVFFVDNRVGWLSNWNGYVGKSTDGGVTWSDLVNLGAEDSNYCLPPAITAFHFLDTTTALALDSHGNIRTMSDGGTTWTRLDLNVGLTYMYFLDAGHGWAVSNDALYRIGPDGVDPAGDLLHR